jgi:hypothetical protein
MACIKYVSGDRRIPCGVPNPGPLNSPKGAKVINEAQILSYSIVGNYATITRNTGAVAAADLETANNSLVVNVALKGGEMYPQLWDVSIEFSFFYGSPVSDHVGAAEGSGANSRCIFAVDHGNGQYRVYGLGNPLDCLSCEGASTGNGYIRTTFGVEDWQTGTTIYALDKASYDALSTVAGGGDAET